MTVAVFGIACGRIDCDREALLGTPGERLTVPVCSWLIDHPSGLTLFDTGLHPSLAESSERLGPLADAFRPIMDAGDPVERSLRSAGFDPSEIATLVLSHLHFDHAGGVASIPNARIVVQERDWRLGLDDTIGPLYGFNRDDYDLGHEILAVEGEHDVYGDGSVVCVPTPGHTPGHQSLLLRREGGDLVLTADAAYLQGVLDGELSQAAPHPEEFADSLTRLRALRDAGARVIPGHDQAVWDSLPKPPQPI